MFDDRVRVVRCPGRWVLVLQGRRRRLWLALAWGHRGHVGLECMVGPRAAVLGSGTVTRGDV